jgi:hypothetical protein
VRRLCCAVREMAVVSDAKGFVSISGLATTRESS